jgi:hypothetical protein
MKWNEKTDEQYEAYATIIAGGDNENELPLSGDDVGLIAYLIDHVIAHLKDGSVEGDLALENLDDQLDQLKKLREQWIAWDDFDCSPIHIYETDMARLETGRISAVDLIDSVKLRQKRIKQTDG